MKKFSQTIVATDDQTAIAMGSGSLPVYSTPSMTALMENTATKAIDNLVPGTTTVGVDIHVKHLKASKPGDELSCTAHLLRIENERFYYFEIEVRNIRNELIGSATHQRVAVDSKRFMKKLEE